MGVFIQNEIFDDLSYNYPGIIHYTAVPHHCPASVQDHVLCHVQCSQYVLWSGQALEQS